MKHGSQHLQQQRNYQHRQQWLWTLFVTIIATLTAIYYFSKPSLIKVMNYNPSYPDRTPAQIHSFGVDLNHEYKG
jgi:hypothetical protein